MLPDGAAAGVEEEETAKEGRNGGAGGGIMHIGGRARTEDDEDKIGGPVGPRIGGPNTDGPGGAD